MKKLVEILILWFFVVVSGNANAISVFKYSEEKVSQELCSDFLNEIKFPTFPYEQKKPFKALIDLQIEDISKIDGKNLDFKAFYTLWIEWEDPRLIEVLKKLQVYEATEEPTWLCDFSPEVFWGAKRTLFDPTIEFFNRKSKPALPIQDIDWVDIYSNGTIGTRLRDIAKFKASTFNFRQFPFDSQTLTFELWSEFPSSIVALEPVEPEMSEYKKTLYNFREDEGIVIPGWNLLDVNYEVSKYEGLDGNSYQGFILALEVQRKPGYYFFKVFVPILLILMLSWSVFWIHPKEIGPKVNITIVTLLTLIAFSLSMEKDLPKLDYITFMDAIILTTYFFTAGATVLCIYSYYRYIKYQLSINLVDYYSKFLGPIFFLLSMFICAGIFL